MSKQPFLSEDVTQIAKAQKAEDDQQQDLIQIMATQRGRRWVHDLIHRVCHVRMVSHMPGDSDTTAFNEGARAVGEAVMVDAQRSPNFILMLQESFPND